MKNKVKKIECFLSWLETFKKLPPTKKPPTPPKWVVGRIGYCIANNITIPYNIRRDHTEYINYYKTYIHEKNK